MFVLFIFISSIISYYKTYKYTFGTIYITIVLFLLSIKYYEYVHKNINYSHFYKYYIITYTSLIVLIFLIMISIFLSSVEVYTIFIICYLFVRHFILSYISSRYIIISETEMKNYYKYIRLLYIYTPLVLLLNIYDYVIYIYMIHYIIEIFILVKSLYILQYNYKIKMFLYYNLFLELNFLFFISIPYTYINYNNFTISSIMIIQFINIFYTCFIIYLYKVY